MRFGSLTVVRTYIIALVVYGLSCIALPGSAQVATGVYSNGSFDTLGLETINVGNLNLHLNIPVMNKNGRGLPFQYNLSYDSSIWYPTLVNGVETWTPAFNWGWKGDTDAVTGFVSYSTTTETLPQQGGPGPNNTTSQTMLPAGGPGGIQQCTVAYYSHWVYYDSYGTAHQFTGTTSTVTKGNVDYCPYSSPSFVATAKDGSGYTINVTFYKKAAISNTHGQHFNAPVMSEGSGTVTDSNGNQLSVDSSGNFTDTTGNVALTVSGTAPSPKTLTYKDTNGNPQSVTVTYSTYTVQTAFGCAGSTAVSEYPATSIPLVDRITLPDGSFYSFAYEPTPGSPSNVTGRLASVTLPTGGTISYTYTGGSNGINCSDGSTMGLARTLSSVSGSSSSVTSYSRSTSSSALSQTTKTDGLNNVTQYSFVLPSNVPISTSALLYPTQIATYQGSATGTPLKNVLLCYNENTQNCSTTQFSLPINEIDSYITLDGIENQHAVTTFDPNSGAVTETGATDFGQTMPTANLLLHQTPVETLSNGIVVPAHEYYWSTPLAGGNLQLIAQTDYGYDETDVQTSSGVPMHTSVSGPRGNLTSANQIIDGTNSYDYQFEYEDTGSLIDSVDPINGSTGLGYDSSFVYQTSVTPPTPSSGANLSSSSTYDTANTGLILSATAPNAEVTSIHSYDDMLRPTEVDYPDNGKTTYAYTPLQTSRYRTMSAGTEDLETLVDAYGRTRRVAIANGQSGNGWYIQDTCYDADGNVGFRSYSYQAASTTGSPACSGVGDSYTYDALGRVLVVQHGTSPTTQTTTTYLGRTTKTVDENGVTKLTQIDGLGRISAVCEITSTQLPNSDPPVSCGMDITGTGYLTTYTYDMVNHTTTITQGGQQRVFQTDWLGRPTSVQEPESGTTTYAYSSNSTGAVVTRVRPKANQSNPSVTTITTTQYDKVGRILSVTYDDGTPTKTFAYDQANATAGGNPSLGYSKGYLTSFAAGNTQGFYGYDPMGRVNLIASCQPVNCSGGSYTQQAYTYDGVGNVLTASDGAGRTATYTYSLASEPQTVMSTPTAGGSTTLVTGAQYGPFGPTTISLGNGLTTVNGYDPIGNLNARWVCANSSSPNCTGGTQAYGMSVTWSGMQVTNASDSVLNQQLTFGYDAMNRLSSRTVTAGTTENFTYAYDRWGNRVSQTALQAGPTMNATFNTATNQLQSVNSSNYTYDAAGHVISDGLYGYTYDAEGNLTGVSGGTTATYIYNALNERVETVTSTSTEQFLFGLNGSRAATLDGSGNAVEDQSYLGSQPLAFYESGSFHYQHQDWIGTERLRTSSSGTAEGSYTSLSFGDYFSATGTDQDSSHFTGLDQDSETGTSHAQFRQYSPFTGTWMQPDPYMGSYDPGNPQSLNRYAYAMNSPLTLIDPLGFIPCVVGMPIYPGGADCSVDVGDGSGVPGGGGAGGGGRGNRPLLPVITLEGGGGSGHGSTAPSNLVNKFINYEKRVIKCNLSTAKQYGVTVGLDAAGTVAGAIPGAGTALVTTQVAIGLAGAANSAYHGDVGGTMAGTIGGAQLSAVAAGAEIFGLTAGKTFGATAARALPWIGSAVSAYYFYKDASEGMDAYQACMAGNGG